MEAVVVELTELIIRIIDFIGEHGTVDNDTRNQLKKARDNAKASITHKIEERNKEELNKKKLEKKRARANEVNKLSPEKQKKYEEKLRKQELKKSLKKQAKKGKVVF
jgi:hypothetical protein